MTFPHSVNGTPVRIESLNLGAITDFFLEVAEGHMPRQSLFRKFGANGSVGASEVVISNTGGTVPYMPTAAVKVNVVSSGTDTAAGAGAQSVYIEGLDANFRLISETMATNGGTTGDSTNSYIRVFRSYVKDVGTYGGSNVNAISVTATGGGTTFVTIGAGYGQTQTTHYCVPLGYTLFIHDMHFNVNTTKYCDMYFWKRENAHDVTTPFTAKRLIHSYAGIVGSHEFGFDFSEAFLGGTDIWMTGNAGAGGANVTVEYVGILVKDHTHD